MVDIFQSIRVIALHGYGPSHSTTENQMLGKNLQTL